VSLFPSVQYECHDISLNRAVAKFDNVKWVCQQLNKSEQFLISKNYNSTSKYGFVRWYEAQYTCLRLNFGSKIDNGKLHSSENPQTHLKWSSAVLIQLFWSGMTGDLIPVPCFSMNMQSGSVKRNSDVLEIWKFSPHSSAKTSSLSKLSHQVSAEPQCRQWCETFFGLEDSNKEQCDA